MRRCNGILQLEHGEPAPDRGAQVLDALAAGAMALAVDGQAVLVLDASRSLHHLEAYRPVVDLQPGDLVVPAAGCEPLAVEEVVVIDNVELCRLHLVGWASNGPGAAGRTVGFEGTVVVAAGSIWPTRGPQRGMNGTEIRAALVAAAAGRSSIPTLANDGRIIGHEPAGRGQVAVVSFEDGRAGSCYTSSTWDRPDEIVERKAQARPVSASQAIHLTGDVERILHVGGRQTDFAAVPLGAELPPPPAPWAPCAPGELAAFRLGVELGEAQARKAMQRVVPGRPDLVELRRRNVLVAR